jgi:hypothetical protein
MKIMDENIRAIKQKENEIKKDSKQLLETRMRAQADMKKLREEHIEALKNVLFHTNNKV